MRIIIILMFISFLTGCSIMILDHDCVKKTIGAYDQTYDTFKRAQDRNPDLRLADKEITVRIEDKTLIQNNNIAVEVEPIVAVSRQKEELK